MRLIHVLRPVALACVLLLGGAQATAAAALDPAYTVDLRAFLDAAGVYEKSVRALTQASDPATAEFAQAMAAQTTPDKLYARMLPVYARRLSPEHARTLGALARHRPVPPAQRDAALQALRAADDKSGAELRAAGTEMGAEFVQRLLANMMAEIRRCTAELAAHRDADYIVKVNKVGMPTMDRIVVLVVDGIRKQLIDSDAIGRACSPSLANAAIKPTELLTVDGVAQARRVLDECEQAMEVNQKQSEITMEELRAGMAALNMPDKERFVQGLDNGMRKGFQNMLEDGELGRRYVGAQRSLIDLLEARRTNIQVADGRFIFASNDDLAEFQRLAGDIDGLKKHINDVTYRRRQQNVISRDLDLHDNITAPQPAAQGTAQ